MKPASEALYSGTVVHRRVRPATHTLRYRVFAILFDCEKLEVLDRRLRLFSYNRFNLFSLDDRDHGNGTSLRAYLHNVARQAGKADQVQRFVMLCYPRILGYVFNPLTVYFGIDADERVCLVIYEVNNTFGERKTYVIPAEADEHGVIVQSCRKRFYVSPFNEVAGTYRFHIAPLDENMTVGIALKDDTGPLLNAYFRGARSDLTDANLLRALRRTGWMTVKVIAGIHYEAAKLWLKGLRLVRRPPAPVNPVTFIDAPNEGS